MEDVRHTLRLMQSIFKRMVANVMLLLLLLFLRNINVHVMLYYDYQFIRYVIKKEKEKLHVICK